MDTVDASFCDEWLANISAVLGEKRPDYLVIQHMEPDHSANITAFMNAYPVAASVMKKMFEDSKNITFTENTVRILSGVKGETVAQLDALADKLLK